MAISIGIYSGMNFLKIISATMLIAIASFSCAKKNEESYSVMSGSVLKIGTKFIGAVPSGNSSEFVSSDDGKDVIDVIETSPQFVSADIEAGSVGSVLATFDGALSGNAAAVAEANAYGNGTVPSEPQIGAGALRLDPAYYGGAADLIVGTGNLAQSVCTFMVGFFAYFTKCTNGTAIDFTSSFGSSGCESTVRDLLIAKGVTERIPAIIVRSLDCVSSKLNTVSCGDATDLSPPIFSALRSCGFYFL